LNNTQPSTLPSHLIIVALLLGFCGTAQAQEQRVLISTPEEIAENFVQVPRRGIFSRTLWQIETESLPACGLT